MRQQGWSRGASQGYPMSCYLASVANSASLSLKPLSNFLVRSTSRPIKWRGLVGIPMALVLLLLGIAAWIFVFFAAPMLLAFVWMVLQPWRLYKFLRSRMTGTNFSS